LAPGHRPIYSRAAATEVENRMATTRTPSDVDPDDDVDLEEAPSEIADEGEDVEWDEDFEDVDDEVEEVDDFEDDEEDADEDDEDVEDDEDDEDEALDELEAEELEMLTDDEASERLLVDEAKELRAIRRAELSLDDEGSGVREADEFQCQSCFLVLKTSQLADKRKKLCRDCAG
jgi:hypothetical protein